MLQNTDGLEEYPNILSRDTCEKIIDMFNNDNRRQKGQTVAGVGTQKVSTDLMCDFSQKRFSKYSELIVPGIEILVRNFKEKYPFLNDGVSHWSLHTDYNIQHYKHGEGYYAIHTEHGYENPYRMGVWMIYLNDAKCGTAFPYQNAVIQAEEGKGVMWSAGWTHAHVGVCPNIGDKYIATGWFNFYKPGRKQKGFK